MLALLPEITDQVAKHALAKGYGRETVRVALENALAACLESSGCPCMVYIDDDFYPHVQLMCSTEQAKTPSLKTLLAYMNDFLKVEEAKIRYEFWKLRKNKAVEATVIGTGLQMILLQLKSEQIAYLPVKHRNPKDEYVPGTSLWVYITRVNRRADRVFVYVSRSSKELPVSLLKQMYPDINAKALWRKPGHKTVMVCDEHIPPHVAAQIAKMVNDRLVRIVHKDFLKSLPGNVDIRKL